MVDFRQPDLFEVVPEIRFWEGLVAGAAKAAKKSLPYRLEEETREEYALNLRDETRLELVHRLRRIADDIENNTLERQRKAIDILYAKEEF